jgi:hypothetical protein
MEEVSEYVVQKEKDSGSTVRVDNGSEVGVVDGKGVGVDVRVGTNPGAGLFSGGVMHTYGHAKSHVAVCVGVVLGN